MLSWPITSTSCWRQWPPSSSSRTRSKAQVRAERTSFFLALGRGSGRTNLSITGCALLPSGRRFALTLNAIRSPPVWWPAQKTGRGQALRGRLSDHPDLMLTIWRRLQPVGFGCAQVRSPGTQPPQAPPPRHSKPYHPCGRHLRGTTGATRRDSWAENFFSQMARDVGSTAVMRSAASTSAGARPGSSADFNP
jgi:hypothetical protein